MQACSCFYYVSVCLEKKKIKVMNQNLHLFTYRKLQKCIRM